MAEDPISYPLENLTLSTNQIPSHHSIPNITINQATPSSNFLKHFLNYTAFTQTCHNFYSSTSQPLKTATQTDHFLLESDQVSCHQSTVPVSNLNHLNPDAVLLENLIKSISFFFHCNLDSAKKFTKLSIKNFEQIQAKTASASTDNPADTSQHSVFTSGNRSSQAAATGSSYSHIYLSKSTSNQLQAVNFLLLAIILYLENHFIKALQAISFGIQHFKDDLKLFLKFKQLEARLLYQISSKNLKFEDLNGRIPGGSHKSSANEAVSGETGKLTPNLHSFILEMQRSSPKSTSIDSQQDHILWLEESYNSYNECVKIAKNISGMNEDEDVSSPEKINKSGAAIRPLTINKSLPGQSPGAFKTPQLKPTQYYKSVSQPTHNQQHPNSGAYPKNLNALDLQIDARFHHHNNNQVLKAYSQSRNLVSNGSGS